MKAPSTRLKVTTCLTTHLMMDASPNTGLENKSTNAHSHYLEA